MMNLYLPIFLFVLVVYAALTLTVVNVFKNINRKRRFPSGILSCVFIVLLIAFDRYSKVYADRHFSSISSETVLPGVIGYSYTRNTGAAWGILADKTWLLSIFTVLVMIVLLYFILVRPLYSPWLHTALLLCAAGGLGNLYDRVIIGSVTDFLIFLFIDFPVFNFADCCITTGAGMALIDILTSHANDPIFLFKKSKTAAESSESNTEDDEMQ